MSEWFFSTQTDYNMRSKIIIGLSDTLHMPGNKRVRLKWSKKIETNTRVDLKKENK